VSVVRSLAAREVAQRGDIQVTGFDVDINAGVGPAGISGGGVEHRTSFRFGFAWHCGQSPAA
jgi:hypothetical protein